MTSPANNAIDIITREVTERVLGDVEARVAGAVQDAQAEAQRRIDELTKAEPIETPVSTKSDAKNRAARTAIQGGLATLLVSASLAFADAVNDNVDLTSSGDWKVIAGTVSGAVLMAGAAYVQRIINPPKG